MGFADALKLVFLPALIAGAIYLIIAYVVVPIYRNYYLRYSQYIPVDSISSRTSGIRSRLSSTLGHYLLPAHMRWRRELVDHHGSIGEEVYFGEEEAENMVGFDVGRRDNLPGVNDISSERRLSRDLEAGFRDSDEDQEEAGDDRRRGE